VGYLEHTAMNPLLMIPSQGPGPPPRVACGALPNSAPEHVEALLERDIKGGALD